MPKCNFDDRRFWQNCLKMCAATEKKYWLNWNATNLDMQGYTSSLQLIIQSPQWEEAGG